jgi:hypothetical protein
MIFCWSDHTRRLWVVRVARPGWLSDLFASLDHSAGSGVGKTPANHSRAQHLAGLDCHRLGGRGGAGAVLGVKGSVNLTAILRDAV